MRGHFYLHTFWGQGCKVFGEQIGNLVPILVRNQTHGNFGVGLAGNDRFCAFPSIASPDTVHIQRRSDTKTFRCRKSFFPMYISNVQRFFIGFQIKGGFGHFGAFLFGNHLYLVIKARNGDMIVFIMQLCNHFGQHVDRVGCRSAINSGVQIAVGPGYFHLHVAQAT